MLPFDDLLSYNMSPYAIFESHISYMFEPCYNKITNFIWQLLHSTELYLKYTDIGSVYTGYSYSTTMFKCVQTSEKSAEHIPIYINIIDNDSEKFLFASLENTGNKQIVVFTNIIRLREKYVEIFKIEQQKYKLYDVIAFQKQFERTFKNTLLSLMNHEFVHIRQMFCPANSTKIPKNIYDKFFNPIQDQIERKSKYEQVINDYPNLSDEQIKFIKRAFYYFTETEMNARISATGYTISKCFTVQEIRNESINDTIVFMSSGKELSPEEKDVISYLATEQEQTITQRTIETCIRMTYDMNDFDDYSAVYAHFLSNKKDLNILKEIDKKAKTNFFKKSLSSQMKEYKRMLIDTIYKELVKKSYDVNKNSSLYIGEIYNHNGISTFNNWISTSKLNEDSIFNI